MYAFAIDPIVFSGEIVTVAISAPCFFAFSAITTNPAVVPDPEPMISKSPSLIGGVVGSPTNDTSNPKCNNLFENPLAHLELCGCIQCTVLHFPLFFIIINTKFHMFYVILTHFNL